MIYDDFETIFDFAMMYALATGDFSLGFRMGRCWTTSHYNLRSCEARTTSKTRLASISGIMLANKTWWFP